MSDNRDPSTRSPASESAQAAQVLARLLIARVEAADAEELGRIVLQADAGEENVLRDYLGDERYQRLRGLALKRDVSRGLAALVKGNVVVIHGIMGGELSSFDDRGTAANIWVRAMRIMFGGLERLALGADGLSGKFDVRATGILKRYYGELLLSLSRSWNVRAFWYDWRKDLRIAAADLAAKIDSWFRPDEPFHIVAHSMGGLVARTFIKNFPTRWADMWDTSSKVKGQRGGRLIMLGTPNHGSFAIPQVMAGLEPTVRKLARLDLRHNLTDLCKILNSFVGSYQMLPSPLVLDVEPLYDAKTYALLNIPVDQAHLERARKSHGELSQVIDHQRMIYIAGCNQPTIARITDYQRMNLGDAYEMTLDGDGRVPHQLGLLAAVQSYYVEENHGDLTVNRQVLGALDELLESGATRGLSETVPPVSLATRGGSPTDPQQVLRLREQQELHVQREDETQIESLRQRLAVRGGEAAIPPLPSAEERRLEETITRGFLSSPDGTGERDHAVDMPFEPATVEIGLVHAGIEEVHTLPLGKPIDALAVGHYVGVKPQFAELALDRAISAAVPPSGGDPAARPAAGADVGRTPLGPGELSESDLLLTQYSERGTIRGELGQPFFLGDPRQEGERQNLGPATTQRVIALAGMGVPGRFGVPELAVLARELCWSLGRMGKSHLATVLIGSGVGNLSINEAVSGWIRGIKHAVSGSVADLHHHIGRITFVEKDARRLREIKRIILREQKRLKDLNRLIIHCDNLLPTDEELIDREKKALAEALRRQIEALEQQGASPPVSGTACKEPAATRITLALERNIYRFGAITESAAVPEREITIDPKLVLRANDELAGEERLAMQVERGQFLEKLLFPNDLRDCLTIPAPLVMLLDATTARLHWEMVAQSQGGEPARGADPSEEKAELLRRFYAISRGFTRQLRTTFAPPPEPPPPPRRLLRVLVVADPARDDSLAGAEAEGVEVADLFERFNTVWKEQDNRVEVVRLLGPSSATRTNVLRELMLRSYDILHFAGHCVFDPHDPSLSGWIFSDGERLTANEMNRIDRIPPFVFSNACESGITPERSGERSDRLAPSFAEAFFARGVCNFICTAWPVSDIGSRKFALKLYSGLLSLDREDDADPYRWQPQAMHEAMRDARLAIARTSSGALTWGAYQHYGNPYYRLFGPVLIRGRQVEASSTGTAAEGPAEEKKSAQDEKRRGKKKV